MIALDTNVVVRLLVGDDRPQQDLARALLRDNACFISKTVLLETSWVLGFTYGFDSASVNSALTALLGYPDVRMEDPDDVLLALDWNRRGLDLADALHLASSSPAPTFATFDRKLAMSAATLESGSEVRLLTP